MSKRKNVFTLRCPMDGKRSVLNGKIFNVLKNTDNKLAFKDVCTGKLILYVTNVIIPVKKTEDGIIFTTKSGIVFDLVNVENIIPTSKAITDNNSNDNNESKQVKENVESVKSDEKPFDPLVCSIKIFQPLNDDWYSNYRYNNIIEWLENDNLTTIGDVIEYIKKYGNFFDMIRKYLSDKTKIYEYDDYIINMIKSFGYTIDTSVEFPKNHKWIVGEFKKPEFVNSNNFSIISVSHSHKNINYGDGYDRTSFMFDRDVTEEEFLNFLKENNFRIHEAKGWWDDHSKIECKNKKWWVYTWILAYTD